jgi:hypothetical protein
VAGPVGNAAEQVFCIAFPIFLFFQLSVSPFLPISGFSPHKEKGYKCCFTMQQLNFINQKIERYTRDEEWNKSKRTNWI